MLNKNNESKDQSAARFILGDIGSEILLAVHKGAKDKATIKLISGVSMECVNGRLPVLISLDLVSKNNESYFITKKGMDLINQFKI
jgi:predicted transcriptional regulator